MPPSTASRRPRTQEERRAATRAALLDATIECLVTHGYARTTTGRIADTAGLSRGAQLPYFRSRADIVTAAVVRLSEQRAAAFDAQFAGRTPSLVECMDTLWEAHRGPLFEATLELWVASRTDPELREHLVRAERRVSAAIQRSAVDALGETAERPGFADDLVSALATMRGLALLQVSNGASSRWLNAQWDRTRVQLAALLAGG